MINFQTTELDNGLRIIAEIDTSALSSAVGFFVRTGARDEAHEVMGVSHFLEHMMFKGTDDISADELNRRFDEMGARNNAYTSGDMTVFYASVLPERLSEADDLLAHMMRPALRQSDFDTEKGVILEEIAMYKDNPFWVLYEASLERHYRGHPLGHRVLGTTDTISNLTSRQMRSYFDDRYAADNTTVALAGSLDFDKCVAQIGALCGSWQRSGATREADLPAVGAGSFEVRDDVGRAYMIGVSAAPPIEDDRRYAASLGAHRGTAHGDHQLDPTLAERGPVEHLAERETLDPVRARATAGVRLVPGLGHLDEHERPLVHHRRDAGGGDRRHLRLVYRVAHRRRVDLGEAHHESGGGAGVDR